MKPYLFIFLILFNFKSLAIAQEEQDPLLQNYSVYKSSQFRSDEINNSYQLELEYASIPVSPQIFYDDNLNNYIIHPQGISFSLAKSFALTSSLFSISSLRFMMAQDSSGELDFNAKRNSQLLNFAFVQQFGVNFLSLKIDRATFHPFIGLGGYRSEFKDAYTISSTGNGEFEEYNKITQTGGLGEAGLSLIDQRSGIFSTIKVGMFFPMNSELESSMDDNNALAINPEGEISNSNLLLYTIGFGVKF